MKKVSNRNRAMVNVTVAKESRNSAAGSFHGVSCFADGACTSVVMFFIRK